MKVALLGHSHIACMIAALNETPGALGKEIEADFFAAPGRNMESLVLDGKRFVPKSKSLRTSLEKSSGGHQSIEIEAYDAFVLFGLRFAFPKLERKFSSAVVSRVLAGGLLQENHWRLLRLLRSATDRPIFSGHKPLPTAEDGDVAEGLFGYDDMFDRLKLATARLNVQLLRQPQETRERDIFTAAGFSKGSRVLKTGELHPEHDNRHMNSDFGRVYLVHLRTVLREAKVGTRDRYCD